MTKPLVLSPPQIPMVEFIRDTPRCALWAGMGIGKSSATLFQLEVMRMCGEIGDPTLVIGPKRVAEDGWRNEAAKWTQFQHLRVVPLKGTPAQRAKLLNQKAEIFTITYELLPWLVEHLRERWPFRTVVADESDRLKGFRTRGGADRATQLARVAHTLTKRWINLTGTPAPNGYQDLWGQTWFLDRGARLGRTYTAFCKRWFAPNWNGYGVRLLKHGKDEIDALLRDITLTVDTKDYFDLHEPIVRRMEVDLPPAVKKLYFGLENDFFLTLDDGSELAAESSAAKETKLRQIIGGAVYREDRTFHELHTAKLDVLDSIVHESGGVPVLCQYHYVHEKDRILKRIRGAVDIATPKGMAAFRAGDSPCGVAHAQSLGHGVDGLQHATNVLVRYAHDWAAGARQQFLERIGPMRQYQGGYDRPVYVYDIVAKDTLDDVMIEATIAKRSREESLKEAMKRRLLA